MKLKFGFILIILTVMLYSDSNSSIIALERLKIEKGLNIFTKKNEYIVIGIETKQVFKKVEEKEKVEVLQKIERGITEKSLEDIKRKFFPIGSISSTSEISLGELPPCEVFDKDKIELLSLLGLESAKLSTPICKDTKDVMDVNLSKDSNFSKTE